MTATAITIARCPHLFPVAWTNLTDRAALKGVLAFWGQRGWRAAPVRASAVPGIWPPAVRACPDCGGRGHTRAPIGEGGQPT